MHFKHIPVLLILIVASINLGKAQNSSEENSWNRFIDRQQKEQTEGRVSAYYHLIKRSSQTTDYDLKKQGIEIIRKLDKNYAIAIIKTPSSAAGLVESWPANNDWKINTKIKSLPPNAVRQTYIQTSDLLLTSRFLAKSSTDYKQVNKNTLLIEASKVLIINELIPRKEIVYVGIEAQAPTVDSRVIDMNLNVNTVNVVHHEYPMLNGSDITISIQEQLFKTNDIDIVGRNLPSSLSAEVETNHATDMATIAAGAGNSFVNGKGVATGATITSSDFTEVLPDADNDYAQLGVSVQNHSYGTFIENFYGVQAEAFDKSANNNPTLVHVISSGNQGLEKDTTGTYAGVEGFANLTGNFKMAKNIITVGSVDTVGRPIAFTSKGPAYDGRVKPEIVTYSTAGSSNSSAMITGIVALLQQAYLDQNGSLPDASLIKALLINSARDKGTKAVDYLTGYGDVDASRSLQNLMNGNYLSGAIAQNQNIPIPLTVPPNAQNLKITIVWNDPAASPNANQALINDLDIELSNLSQSWLPWILDATSNAASLAQPAIRSADHLNNVEQITVDNPDAGDYTINIDGFDVPDGSQDFYIAYQWDLANEFSWTYPTASDNMPYDGETGSYFRWNSTLSSASGELAYSIDNGSTWEVLSSNVNLSSGSYRWLPPEINEIATARMTVNNVEYFTDNFSISRPQRIDVAFNCPDSVLIQWPQVQKATGYEIFTMGDKYLEKITTTSDTAYVFRKENFSTRFFTIRPTLSSGNNFIESYTIDYDLQGVSCYLISFFPELTEGNELFLNLELGTTYGVKEVIFERKIDGDFEQMAIVNAQSKSIRVQETNPLQGPNAHRVIIKFLNGEEIVTEESLIYFLTDTPFMVFPNPVQVGDELSVFSRPFESDTEVIFRLLTRTGQIKQEELLQSDRAFVLLETLNPGLYIYTVTAGDITTSGKLVVLE